MKLIQKKYLILLFSMIIIIPLWSQQDITGTWNIDRENVNTTMTLREDKTVEFSGKTGYWDVVDDLLILIVDGSQASYTWQIKGNILTLVNTESGTTLSLSREQESVDSTSQPFHSSHQSESSDNTVNDLGSSARTGSVIGFIRMESNGGLSWCSIDPQSGDITSHQTFDDQTIITEPAKGDNGNTVVFAVKHATHPRLLGTVRGEPFEINFPANSDIQVKHPTISRDGKLLAFSMRSAKHVGNVNVYDWNSGAYDHTYMAVGSWYKVFSIDLKTGKQQAVYHDDALVPDVMKKRGLGPVFSPAEDILVFADNYRLHVCNALSGEEIQTIEVPVIQSGGWQGKALVSEYSGMAFTPDGNKVAYLSQGEADIAVSPCWVILINIHTTQSQYYELPNGISGASPYGVIGMDFSADGQYMVFSVTQSDLNHPFLAILNLQTGGIQYLTNAGYAFDPVWKGR
ncbi:MAG: hypothetical protein R6V04_02250 [bacterium]